MDPRISLLLEVDHVFSDFAIQVRPDEARLFAISSKGSDAVHDLISQIDLTIPLSTTITGHPEKGFPHHAYRIGREVGKRLLTLEVTKAHFERHHDFSDFLITIHKLAQESGALARTIDRDHAMTVEFLWLDRHNDA